MGVKSIPVFAGILILSLIFTACPTPFARNEGGATLTISLTGNARTAAGFNNAVDFADLGWTITLTSNKTGEVLSAEINADGTHATVTGLEPGNWDILVGVSIFGTYPYAQGEIQSFRVNPGQNTAAVQMQRIPNAIALSVASGSTHAFPPVLRGDTSSPLEITVYNFTGSDPLEITAALEYGDRFTVPSTIEAAQDDITSFFVIPNTGAAGDFVDTLTISANGSVIASIGLSSTVTALPGYTISFDSNGGSSVDSQIVEQGTPANKPSPDPTLANHQFTGWFTQLLGGTEWNFDTPITSDMTLYARWRAGLNSQQAIADYLNDYNYTGTPVHLPIAMELTRGNWTGILNAINGADPVIEEIDLDLSACTRSTTTGTNHALTDNGVFYPGNHDLPPTSMALSRIVSMTMPEEAEEIAEEAFHNLTPQFTWLEHVNTGNGVKFIGTSAFRMINSVLKSVVLGNSVTTIGNMAFMDTTLESVNIPNGVISIGGQAFNQTRLTEVTIPASVTSLAGGSFGINSLVSVTFLGSIPVSGFPENQGGPMSTPFFGNLRDMYYIYGGGAGTYTWSDSHYQLWTRTGATEPFSMRYDSTGTGIVIEKYTGAAVPVTIPGSVNGTSVREIGYAAFEASFIPSIIIPDSVTVINASAFSGTLLTELVIPDSVITIEDEAFSYIFTLESVVIGSSVAAIGSEAFHSCNYLEEVEFRGAAGTLLAANFAADAFPGPSNDTEPGNLKKEYFDAGGGPSTFVRYDPGFGFNEWELRP